MDIFVSLNSSFKYANMKELLYINYKLILIKERTQFVFFSLVFNVIK